MQESKEDKGSLCLTTLEKEKNPTTFSFIMIDSLTENNKNPITTFLIKAKLNKNFNKIMLI